MRKRRHPLSGAMYEVRDDGLVQVEEHGAVGLFTADGDWVSGALTHCDPQLCGWLAGRQLPPGAGGNPKDLANQPRTLTTTGGAR